MIQPITAVTAPNLCGKTMGLGMTPSTSALCVSLCSTQLYWHLSILSHVWETS